MFLRSTIAISIALLGCSHRDMNSSNWNPEPPPRLEMKLYRSARQMSDIDDRMWLYLLSLIKESSENFLIGEQNLVESLSPELRRYYLVRRFDSEWGSGGMAHYFMNENWRHLLPETISAYESIGASEHALVIRRIVPVAESEQARFMRAEKDGKVDEFFDMPSPLEDFDGNWQQAGEKFNFLNALFQDIKRNPEPYLHPPSVNFEPKR